jgi:hypothetical protein
MTLHHQPPEPELHVVVPPDETDLRVQIASAPALLPHGPILTTGEFITFAAGLHAQRTRKPLPIGFVKHDSKPANEG